VYHFQHGIETCKANQKSTLSHTKDPSYFVWACFGYCIFTIKMSYFINTYFKRLKMDIQQILILCSNFRHLVSNVFARVKNSKNLFKLFKKNAYNDSSIPSMCVTKSILLITKTKVNLHINVPTFWIAMPIFVEFLFFGHF
jgi:hypothetical protein